jgi:hypothetical protein
MACLKDRSNKFGPLSLVSKRLCIRIYNEEVYTLVTFIWIVSSKVFLLLCSFNFQLFVREHLGAKKSVLKNNVENQFAEFQVINY